MPGLRVVVDGKPLGEPEARATWERFSAHMDQHRGDFAGFAASEGYVHAAVAVAGTTPTLTLASVAPNDDAVKPPETPARRSGAGPPKRRRQAGVDVGGQRPKRNKGR